MRITDKARSARGGQRANGLSLLGRGVHWSCLQFLAHCGDLRQQLAQARFAGACLPDHLLQCGQLSGSMALGLPNQFAYAGPIFSCQAAARRDRFFSTSQRVLRTSARPMEWRNTASGRRRPALWEPQPRRVEANLRFEARTDAAEVARVD